MSNSWHITSPQGCCFITLLSNTGICCTMSVSKTCGEYHNTNNYCQPWQEAPNHLCFSGSSNRIITELLQVGFKSKCRQMHKVDVNAINRKGRIPWSTFFRLNPLLRKDKDETNDRPQTVINLLKPSADTQPPTTGPLTTFTFAMNYTEPEWRGI